MSPHDDDSDNNDDDDDKYNRSSNNYFSQNASSKLPTAKKKLNERDYEEIYFHFDTVAQDVLLANANLLLVPPEPAEHYEWEEIIIDEASQDEYASMVQSLMFGMGCGIFSFGALRYRRIHKFNNFFKAGGVSGHKATSKYYGGSHSSTTSCNSSGGYAFDPPPPPSKIGHNNGTTGGGRLGFGIDVVLSTSLGLLTSLLVFESDIFYPQPTPILSSSLSINNNNNETTATNDKNDDNSQKNDAVLPHPILPPQWISPIIPLVPGRSILADTLCGPLTAEFRQIPKEFWQGGSRNIGIEAGFHNHMSLYANMGWRGTKYYQQQQQQQQQQQGLSKEQQQQQQQHHNLNLEIASGGRTKKSKQEQQSHHDNVNVEILGENPTDLNYNNIGVYERLVLDNLQGFVINCERRSRHEAKLRKLRYPTKRGGLLLGSGSSGSSRGGNGWSDQQQQQQQQQRQLSPVVIPDEGVFADEDLELDDIYFANDDYDE